MQIIEPQQERLLEPTYAEKIQSQRLEKEIQFLKSLNRSYSIKNKNEVVVQSILHDNLNLHIYIPKQYPFQQPLYAISSQPQQKYRVSSAMDEWVPKFKILEVVQLLAQRINQKYQITQKVSKYLLLKPFLQTKAVPLIIALAILLRIILALGSYSGKGDYPYLGDFQAHRNWMSITVNRPIHSWYQESQAQPWWRIDYPPVAAYLSYVFGMLYKSIQPQALNIQRGYQSESLKVYMRFTVLLVDILLLFPPIILLSRELNKNLSSLLILAVLFKPDQILIDHGHFQYNSLILGLILLSFYFLLTKKYYYICICYTIAIHSKQMAVYYSLAFFASLIGLAIKQHNHNKFKIMAELIKYGLIVIIVSLIIWAPWINDIDYLSSVVSAIFPVHRGLYQLKVPNFWCISDIVFKWQAHFSKQTLLFFCFLASIVASIPSIVSLIVNPSKKSLTVGFATISLTFFMFSYHVHQKSILLPLLMFPFVGQIIGGSLAFDVIIAGCVGMFHLLKEDGQQLGYFAIITIFYLINSSYVTLKSQIKESKDQSVVLSWHHTLYSNKTLRVLNLGIILALHINQKMISPPQNLPYLHNLLFAFYCFTLNSYFLVLANLVQLQWVYEWSKNLSKKSI